MEQPILPLNFYCRNARLCLKKAAFSKKSQFLADELQHLKKFEALVSSTIPSHPLFHEKKGEKHIEELQMYLVEARKRIQELESDSVSSNSQPILTPKGLNGEVEGPDKTTLNSKSFFWSEFQQPTQKAQKKQKITTDSPRKNQNWANWSNEIPLSTLYLPAKKLKNNRDSTGALEGELTGALIGSKQSSESPLMRSSNSQDQRLDAILGGCTILATQLHNFDRKKKSEKVPADFKLDLVNFLDIANSVSGRSGAGDIDLPRGSFKWRSDHSRRKTSSGKRAANQESTETQATETGKEPPGRRFRFASEFFEKKLQETMNRVQHQHSNTQEDSVHPGKGGAMVPKEMEERLHERESFQGSLHADDDKVPFASDPQNQMNQHLNYLSEKLHATTLNKDKHLDGTQETSSCELWPKSLVSSLEHRLGHGVLRPFDGFDQVSLRVHPKQNDFDSRTSNYTIRSSFQPETSRRNMSDAFRKGEIGQSLQIDSSLGHGPVCQQTSPRLQAEILEEKITSLQRLVGELKGSIQRFSGHVEQEGERWHSKVEGLERELQVLREETDKELGGLKENIRAEVKLRLNELAENLFAETEKENFKEKVELRLDDCITHMESLQREVESLVAETKACMLKEVKEKVTETVQITGDSMKKDIAALELGISKDIESLRQDIGSRFYLLQVETEKSRNMDMKQLEALLEERVDRRISQRLEVACEEKEKFKAEIKDELHLLWAEVDLLSKKREEVKDHVEGLADIAEKAKESINIEQTLLKAEYESIKKQMQYFKKDNMQSRIDAEEFKKETELDIENIKRCVGKLKDEAEDVKASISNLKKLDISLKAEKTNLRKLIEKMKEEEAERKTELDIFRNAKEELEKLREVSKMEGNRERLMIMERVESLSQFYLGGLEEVREDFLNMKQISQDRMQELEHQWQEFGRQQENMISTLTENSLRDLVVDALETRISLVESKLEERKNFDKERFDVENALSLVVQDRNLAANAAAEAATSAKRVEELLAETFESFTSEISNVRRKSSKLQESLTLERNAVAAVANDIRRISSELNQERQTAMAAYTEARERSLEIQECIEQERANINSSMVSLENERVAATAAATDAAAASSHAAVAASEAAAAASNAVVSAEKAQETLVQLSRTQIENLSAHDDIVQALKKVQNKCGKDLDKQIEDWRKSMLSQSCLAKSVVEEMEDEKRRASDCLSKLSDIAIECTAKIALQEELGRRIKESEVMLEQLERSSKELNASLELHFNHSETKITTHLEELEEKARDEIDRLQQQIRYLASRLEQILQVPTDTKEQGTEETLQNNLNNLEKKVKDAATEQSNIAAKVAEVWNELRKLETIQMQLSHSVDDVQTDTEALKTSTATWLPKYEAAAKILNELECKVQMLEASMQKYEQHPEQPKFQTESPPQENLLNLYKEMSEAMNKLKTSEGSSNEETDAKITPQTKDSGDNVWDTTLDTNLSDLKSHLEQVESTTFSNLRILDAKMEHFSVGVQTALEGAAMAESKCSALGTELVKVFRMLASNRNQSPSKIDMDETSDRHLHSRSSRQYQRSETPGGIKASSPPRAACVYCKKAAMTGSGSGFDASRDFETKHREREAGSHGGTITTEGFIHVNGNKVIRGDLRNSENRNSPLRQRATKECAIHGKHVPELRARAKPDLYGHGINRHASADPSAMTRSRQPSQIETLQDREYYSSKRDEAGELEQIVQKLHSSDIRGVMEGKLPITQERLDDKRFDCTKKHNMHSSSPLKGYQMTTIRL